jgi:uncharacterized protein
VVYSFCARNLPHFTALKLHLDRSVGKNAITAQETDNVTVNGERFSQAILVPDQGTVTVLSQQRLVDLTPQFFEHFAQLDANLRPELLLIGTGQKQQFLHPAKTQALSALRIGVEFMPTAAAARTFNILVGEDRRCSAILFFET